MNRNVRLVVVVLAVAMAGCPKKNEATEDSASAATTASSPGASTGATTTTAATTPTTPASSAPAAASSPVAAASSSPPPASTVASAGSESLASYTKFSSTPGNYEILMPAKPEETEKASASGAIDHKAKAKSGADEVLVSWKDAKDTSASTLNAPRDAVLKLLDGGTATPMKVLGKYDGIEIHGKLKDTKQDFHERMFFANGRFYQVIVAGMSSTKAGAVFDSFKILGEATTTADTSGVPAVCTEALHAMEACAKRLPGPAGTALRLSARTSEAAWKKAAGTPIGRKGLETSCKVMLSAQRANPLCK